MSEHVTKEELDRAIQTVNDSIDDIKDNHLGSIYAGIVWLSNKIEKVENRFYKIIGIGIALIAIVLAILEVMG